MPTYRITVSFDVDKPNLSQAQAAADAIKALAASGQAGQGAHVDVQVVSK